MDLDNLDRKLARADKKAKCQKRRYWKLRMQVIKYLGGGCSICGDFDPTHLEIHHDPPLTWAVKRKGFTRGERSGGNRIQWWKRILAGEETAKLFCHRCHIEDEHHGNTNALKDGGTAKDGDANG